MISSRRHRWAISPALALTVLGSLGCKVVIERASDSARAMSRSDTTVVLASPARVDTAVVPQARTPVVSPVSPSTAGGEVTDTPPAGTSASDLGVLSSELIIPLAGVKASELRDTFNELRGGGTRKHEALDIMAPRGTPVLSASAGRVLKLHDSKDGGLMVYAADASNRFVLMYAHLDHYADGMQDGLPLRQGQVIGYVGTTGDAAADAPHLHFAIAHPTDVKLWWTGTAIDPRPLLQQSGSGGGD
jgi:murein DD-endopeptidase MepM/ murein hydrolase activator NlpD